MDLNGFPSEWTGMKARMVDTKSIPKRGERWLSCPPYTLIAHVLGVEQIDGLPLVSYELQDDDGVAIERVEHAVLDDRWWSAFQPMRQYFG
jgi:hypothetical protein